MRAPLAAAAALVAVAGCDHATLVHLTVAQGASDAPPIARIELALGLQGRTAHVTLSEPGGGAIQFPTDATLQIGSGAGTLSVDASAFDADGAAVEEQRTTVPVRSGKTAMLTLVLGDAMLPDMGAGDMAPGGDLGPPDGLPSAPQLLAAAPDAPGSVLVSWMPPAMGAGISGYILGWTPTGGGSSSQLTLPATTKSYSVTGLTGDTEYTFSVAAVNAVGTGPAATTGATACDLPVAPTITGASADKPKGVSVSWAGVAAGGCPITQYQVTSNPATTTQSFDGSTSSTVMSPLVPGTAYTFTVTAVNPVGSTASAPSSPVVAIDVPGALTAFSGTQTGNGAVRLDWSGPTADSGHPVSKYVLTLPGPSTRNEPAASTSDSVTGLSPGTAQLSIVAVNASGSGPAASTSVAVVAPPAPPTVYVCPQPGTLTFYMASANATSYNIRYGTSAGAENLGFNNVSSPYTINSLNNGTTYFYTATATNVAGTSAASSEGSAVPTATVHDALFGAAATTIEVWDCFSDPNVIGSNRSFTVANTTSGGLAVDAGSASVYVGSGNGIQNSWVSVYPTTASNSTTAARTIRFSDQGMTAIGLDPTRNGGTLYAVFPPDVHIYTGANTLDTPFPNSATPSDDFRLPGGFNGLWVDVPNDRLYVSIAATGIVVYDKASTLTGDNGATRSPDRTFFFTDAPATQSYFGVIVEPSTNYVYTGDFNNKRIFAYNRADTASGSLAATHVITDALGGLAVNLFALQGDDAIIAYGHTSAGSHLFFLPKASEANGDGAFGKQVAGSTAYVGLGYAP